MSYTKIPLTIVYLADCPQHLSTIAEWIFREWGHQIPGLTYEQQERIFLNHLRRDAIPLTLVALHEGRPVGTASLQVTDMTTRPDLSPWLACVYVPPEERGKGIGSAIVKSAETAGKKLNIPKLYLFTPDKEKFYLRLGWTVIETTVYRHQPVVIMSKDL